MLFAQAHRTEWDNLFGVSGNTPLEIERVFLLRQLPELPEGAAAYEIEQGYLPDEEPDPNATAVIEGQLHEGRLRRQRSPDGTTRFIHTVKHGGGLIREEIERELDEASFIASWERTAGRRIAKTRHKVREGDLVWEVDTFTDLDLFMAEVELPTADHAAPIPPWLEPHIVRELTEDPRYRNYILATKGLPEGHAV